MSLFRKTLLQCLAVAAVGGILCAVFLALEKFEWHNFIFTDTTIIACCLITLLSVPMLCYAFKHRAENISDEAKEAIRWLLFAMMALLFLGILACIFCNLGAVAAAVSFVVVSFFVMKVLTGKTYEREENKWYSLKNEMAACLAMLLVVFSLYSVMDFANHEYVRENPSSVSFPLLVASFVINVFNSRK